MYIKYSWLGGQTNAQFLSDIAALASGETNLNALSAGADKVNSQIIASTIPTNWTLFDGTASPSNPNMAIVMRSLNADGTTYKYLHIQTGAAITLTIYESWNAATKSGVNQCGANAAVGSSDQVAIGGSLASLTATLTAAGTVYILATNRYLVFIRDPLTGDKTAACVEMDPSEFQYINNTYPLGALLVTSISSGLGTQLVNSGNGNGIGLSRIKDPATGTDVARPNNTVAMALTTVSGASTPVGRTVIPAFSIRVCTGVSGVVILGTLLGGVVWFSKMHNAAPLFSTLDEFQVGATRYVMLKSFAGALCFPKG